MAELSEIVAYCNQRLRIPEIKDFPGAENGLQVENRGQVHKVGAVVDAGLQVFESARERGIDLLIAHHGMFWTPLKSISGRHYRKLASLFEGDCALYSAHLPLDCHAEIGNNALLARALRLMPESTFLPYEGVDIGLIARCDVDRSELAERMQQRFPATFCAIEYGAVQPERVAILSGSGTSAVPYLKAAGVDTLITGELKQNVFNDAQELGLNLYMGGHYATETFGVCALAAVVGERFGLPWEFIETECPL